MFLGTPTPQAVNLSDLEYKLKRQESPHQRLILLDRLCAHYIYTKTERASELLEEFRSILEQVDNPDLLLNYHLYAATLANHQYDYDAAYFHYTESIKLLEERGTTNQQVEAYIDYAGLCINQEDMELATSYLSKADKLLKTFPDDRLRARLICREGFLSLHYANYAVAIEQFLAADKMIGTLEQPLTLKDYYFLTLIHSGLGRIYERNDEREKSVTAYLKVVEMSEAMGLRTRLSWHYVNVGNSYMGLNEQEKAETYFRKATEVSDDTSEHARASAFANLGYCSLEREQHKEALRLFNRAEQLYRRKSDKDYYNFSNIALWRGQLYRSLKQLDRAHQQIDQALAYAELQQDAKQLASIYKEMASLYAEEQDYEQAYHFQCRHDDCQERYMEEVDQRKQREVEAKYEAEKKRQETELLRLQATRLQLKALRAQMNPHFMYNALNSIQNYITSHDVASATKYLAKFAQLMRRSLEYSDLEIISLENEIEFLEDYLFINEKLRFEDKLKYEITIDEEIEEDILRVPTMIVQPYVENAIEHGLRSRAKGLIKVFFLAYDENTILCVVEDNGIGREKARQLQTQDPQYQNHRSRGTSITEERLRLLHSAGTEGLFVHTTDLKDDITGEALGTRVEIKIPIVEIKVSNTSSSNPMF